MSNQSKESHISLIELYLIFVKIGAILLGGGYVILPILTSELCEKRNLITETELIDFYALSQSLPGIVAANISMFTGYKFCGKIGALAAMFGVITVPFFCIVLLASVLELLANNSYINGIFWGVGFAVIALILLTVREMWQKSEKNTFFYLIFIPALITLSVFKISPVSVILCFSILGLIIKFAVKRRGV